MDTHRIAAFSRAGHGGNPAGVVLLDAPLDAAQMQQIAARIGYSETAFLHRTDDDTWRTRYFAPRVEVPFCGHATIAAGAVLAQRHGDGRFMLRTNTQTVAVQARASAGALWAAFDSPPTRQAAVAPADRQALLDCFGLAEADLDPALPLCWMHAGAGHVLMPLRSRRRLSHIGYAFEELAALQRRMELATVALVHRDAAGVFHARNPFAVGGVYEDPATGAAAAALGGCLRDGGLLREGTIEIVQGEDMGVPCRIEARVGGQPGAPVTVAGEARVIGDDGA